MNSIDQKLEQVAIRIARRMEQLTHGIADVSTEMKGLLSRLEMYSTRADAYLKELQKYTHKW